MQRSILPYLALLAFSAISSAAEVGQEKCLHLGKQAEVGPLHPPLSGVVVASGRSYFYSAPDVRCRGTDFVVKGNNLVIYVPYKKWFQAYYVGPDSPLIVGGWLLQSSVRVTGTEGPSSDAQARSTAAQPGVQADRP